MAAWLGLLKQQQQQTHYLSQQQQTSSQQGDCYSQPQQYGVQQTTGTGYGYTTQQQQQPGVGGANIVGGVANTGGARWY